MNDTGCDEVLTCKSTLSLNSHLSVADARVSEILSVVRLIFRMSLPTILDFSMHNFTTMDFFFKTNSKIAQNSTPRQKAKPCQSY